MADTSQRRRFLQCPRCGAENLPLNKFCGQCGASLRGESTAAATTMPPKGGTLLPYVPGATGPGKGARLMIAALIVIFLACLVLFYFYLASGADRAPARPTSTPAALVVSRQLAVDVALHSRSPLAGQSGDQALSRAAA